MTLSTVSRYDPDAVTPRGDHAVVVGGSIAGLLAARVLADAFERVTVFERDEYPTDAESRRGVPQGTQIHALLEAGRATLEDLFPGYGERLLEAGGILIDGASDIKLYQEGGVLADGPRRFPVYSASRPLFEQVVRERLTEFDGVTVRADSHVAGYRTDGAATTVTGVTVRDGETTTSVDADLVVDATGRTSTTPEWLTAHGYDAPPVDEVTIDIGYSTTALERPPDDRRAFLMPASAPQTRGGAIFPIEGGRWLVNLHGVTGDHPPTTFADLPAFASTLPVDDVAELLERYPQAGEVEFYPFPSSRRRYYESLDRFPDGLLVTGDAIASFNPIYGQGISTAALEALHLHHALASGDDSLPARFFDRAADVVDIAWTMSTGADAAFAGTSGSPPLGAGLFDRYLSRLSRKAHDDGRLRDAFFRVTMMERHPKSLFRPGVLARVLAP